MSHVVSCAAAALSLAAVLGCVRNGQSQDYRSALLDSASWQDPIQPGPRLAGAAPATIGAAVPENGAITLEEAVAFAFANSPQLLVLEARLDQVRGALITARTYPHNPQLEVTGARRKGADESGWDYGAAVSQALEIGGQLGGRVDVAAAELAATEADITREKQIIAAEVAIAFGGALAARELLAVTEADAELANELVEISRKRLAAGASTQLEVNVSLAEAARAQRRLYAADAAYRRSLYQLAGLLGLPPTSIPELAGDLAMRELEPPPALPALLEAAIENRADLDALARELEAATELVDVRRSEVIPDLVVGGFIEREEETDTIYGLTLSIGIPLFDRNQGAIHTARAQVDGLTAEQQTRRLAITSAVAAAHADYAAAHQAMNRLARDVLGALQENLELLRKAFEAGKVTWTELLVMRQAFIEAQRELVEAAADVYRARVVLDLAAGSIPIPTME